MKGFAALALLAGAVRSLREDSITGGGAALDGALLAMLALAARCVQHAIAYYCYERPLLLLAATANKRPPPLNGTLMLSESGASIVVMMLNAAAAAEQQQPMMGTGGRRRAADDNNNNDNNSGKKGKRRRNDEEALLFVKRQSRAENFCGLALASAICIRLAIGTTAAHDGEEGGRTMILHDSTAVTVMSALLVVTAHMFPSPPLDTPSAGASGGAGAMLMLIMMIGGSLLSLLGAWAALLFASFELPSSSSGLPPPASWHAWLMLFLCLDLWASGIQESMGPSVPAYLRWQQMGMTALGGILVGLLAGSAHALLLGSFAVTTANPLCALGILLLSARAYGRDLRRSFPSRHAKNNNNNEDEDEDEDEGNRNANVTCAYFIASAVAIGTCAAYDPSMLICLLVAHTAARLSAMAVSAV